MQQVNGDISLKDKIHFAISDIEDEKFLEAILVTFTYAIDCNKESRNNTLAR